MQQQLHYVEPPFHNSDGALPRVNSKRRKILRSEPSPLQVLQQVANAAMPTETRILSEELAQTTLAAEKLAQTTLSASTNKTHIVQVARAAWLVAERWKRFGLEKRSIMQPSHRIALWIARLRCIGLASSHCLEAYCGNNDGDDDQSASTATGTQTFKAAQGRRTRELRQARLDAVQDYYDTRSNREFFAAHAVLWPHDTKSQQIHNYCSLHELLTVSVKDIDEDLRNASVVLFWKLIKTLLKQWNELPYCAQLVAYVERLLERCAELCMYSGTSLEFNHPFYSTPLGSAEFCINDRFLQATERTFYALEMRLHKCSFLHWPGPPAVALRASSDTSSSQQPTARRRSSRSSALLGIDAVKRFEAFVSEQLENGRFTEYIEKNFQVVFYDHMVMPGEMERFEQLRPYDDRKALTCVSRMRRNDFDRCQRLFMDPKIATVWSYLLDHKMRTHPAYMVIASRVIQYYFDAEYNGASFDAYFVSIDKVPAEHLAEGASSALRDFGNDTMSVQTRGSARHTLCGTLLRQGLACTSDTLLPHPLIVECIGVPCVVVDDNVSVLAQRGLDENQKPNFATAFLLWLREFCGDERLWGTLTNGHSVASMLRLLEPTADSKSVAKQAERAREALNVERAQLTGLEKSVQNMQVYFPQKTDNNTIVLQ